MLFVAWKMRRRVYLECFNQEDVAARDQRAMLACAAVLYKAACNDVQHELVGGAWRKLVPARAQTMIGTALDVSMRTESFDHAASCEQPTSHVHGLAHGRLRNPCVVKEMSRAWSSHGSCGGVDLGGRDGSSRSAAMHGGGHVGASAEAHRDVESQGEACGSRESGCRSASLGRAPTWCQMGISGTTDARSSHDWQPSQSATLARHLLASS
jgi:hypothetical protein